MGHKGLRILESDARALAEAYVATLDAKGWRYQFGTVHIPKSEPDSYSVVFDMFSPQGNPVDGPVIVLVNRQTGKVRLFDWE